MPEPLVSVSTGFVGGPYLTPAPAAMHNLELVQDRLIASGLLTPENNTEIAALSTELRDTWEKRQVFRTEMEMRVSVLNDEKHPTLASKYWQAVREQANMLDNLAVVGFEYRRNELKIREIEAGLQTEDDEFKREALQIDLDEALFKRAGMQQTANDRMRELRTWSRLKKELDNGSFDTENVNTHQLVSMYHSLMNRLRALKNSNSSQAEVINVTGPLRTAERLLAEAGIDPRN